MNECHEIFKSTCNSQSMKGFWKGLLGQSLISNVRFAQNSMTRSQINISVCHAVTYVNTEFMNYLPSKLSDDCLNAFSSLSYSSLSTK